MKTIAQSKLRKMHAKGHIPALFLSILMLSLVLLSACSTNSGNTASSTSTVVPTPVIDSTLKNQGDMQLHTLQQWIALMQQYNVNTTTFQQQYNADQQALNNATTEDTYKSALAKLIAHVEAIKIQAMKTEIQSIQ